MDIKLISNDSLIVNHKCNTNRASLKHNQLTFSDSVNKLDIIGTHFKRINSLRYLNDGTSIRKIVDSTAEIIKQEAYNFKTNNVSHTTFNDNLATNLGNPDLERINLFCTPLEVENILKKLPNEVSSGLDNISPIILKHLPQSIIKSYTILFNNALNRHYFPTSWKRAKVLPIYKKEKYPSDRASYRPMNSTPSISKVFEIILNKRIFNECTDNKVIPDNQFGFWHRHSTTHPINKLASDIVNNLRLTQHTAALMIDLEKVFDSGWTNGLLFKCPQYNFSKWLIFMILESITEKSFITWDRANISSFIFAILEGFQKGTVNSSILFIILTAKIISTLNQTLEQISYATKSIAFADDAIIYLSGTSVPTL